MRDESLTKLPKTIEALPDYCRDLTGTVSKSLRKKFREIVFDYYDSEGPGYGGDTNSEIYVFDKASFTQNFFEDLGVSIFEIDNSDLYRSFKERSSGYKEAYKHTQNMFSEIGGSDELYA